MYTSFLVAPNYGPEIDSPIHLNNQSQSKNMREITGKATRGDFPLQVQCQKIPILPWGKCHFVSHTYLWYIFASTHPFVNGKRNLRSTSSMPPYHTHVTAISHLAVAIFVP
jgi:hypothetical protein